MVFLIVVLGVLSFRTLNKGLEMFHHENASGPQALPQEDAEEDSVDAKPRSGTNPSTLLPPEDQEVASDEEDMKESRNLVGGSMRRVQRSPNTKVALLICCFLGCVVLTILKGSGHGSIVGTRRDSVARGSYDSSSNVE
eukprot:symbB.v1.2.027962.t1/scaffold2908.1/size67487/5